VRVPVADIVLVLRRLVGVAVGLYDIFPTSDFEVISTGRRPRTGNLSAAAELNPRLGLADSVSDLIEKPSFARNVSEPDRILPGIGTHDSASG